MALHKTTMQQPQPRVVSCIFQVNIMMSLLRGYTLPVLDMTFHVEAVSKISSAKVMETFHVEAVSKTSIQSQVV
eukprot:scaffold1786_cov104-Skeletonema_dohrnii-CCMP3373.AAC.7